MSDRFCRDCKWARQGRLARLFNYWGMAHCAKPEFNERTPNIDRLVSGREPSPSDFFLCSTNRRWDCGVEGSGWEQKT